MNPTEQAHRNLANLLLNGRILINGLPLTGNELSQTIQQEQLLYQKATQFDKASQLAAEKKAKEEDNKDSEKKKE